MSPHTAVSDVAGFEYRPSQHSELPFADEAGERVGCGRRLRMPPCPPADPRTPSGGSLKRSLGAGYLSAGQPEMYEEGGKSFVGRTSVCGRTAVLTLQLRHSQLPRSQDCFTNNAATSLPLLPRSQDCCTNGAATSLSQLPRSQDCCVNAAATSLP